MVPAGSPPPPEPPWVRPLEVPLPAYCRLGATIDPRIGADGRSYGIGFAVALPAEWNGRFLFQGGGGLNGSVAPPLGRTGRGETALSRGFAVVTTDTGHRGEVFDASFMADPQASLDFAYQAVGRVASLAKQILALHNGKPPAHSYFMGCSTGGREGMLMAQRHFPARTRERTHGIISFDRSRKAFVLLQFHVEGNRARETCRATGPDEFTEVFEMADPNKDFAVYSESRLKRTP